MKTIKVISTISLALALTCSAETEKTIISVNPEHFHKESIIGDIIKAERSLSDGTKTMCYVFQTKSVPHEHKMGPWAPRTITDGKDKGGIWIKDGEVYDVDGPFIKNLATFYDDDGWKLYNDDGTVKVTITQEAAEAAARPDVDPKYYNYAVECNPDFYKNHITTYVIPVTPIHSDRAMRPRRGGVGLAFNGVNYDPPAPIHMIIRAHTIAPFDDHGGHVNAHVGYHYHAATGNTEELAQADTHAPMIGYALDGYGIYAHLDKDGKASKDLDTCQGHYDSVRGYHYHAGAPGDNSILSSFRGIPGTMEVKR